MAKATPRIFATPNRPWQQNLIITDKGAARPLVFNAALILGLDPVFADAIRFDAFRGQAMVCAPLPWDATPNVPRPWRDQDDREACAWLQDTGLFVGEILVHAAVQMVAERLPYHPVMDYLNSVRWDGTDRLDRWLINYLGAPDTPYIEIVGARWLISGVARVYEPGCKADCVLVLEGPQGILKSSTFQVLGGAFYSDDIAAIGSKDAQEQLLGIWILEIPELDAITRAREVSAVTAFVSRAVDRFRWSYGRRVESHPRQCIFGATTNRDTWQHDETGGRRWWPVRCGRINIDQLRVDRDQLWAEARDRYLTGERWWLHEPEIIATQQSEIAERYDGDVWTENVLTAANDIVGLKLHPEERRVTIGGILQMLQFSLERRDQYTQKRVASILRNHGWKRRRRLDDPNDIRSYYFAPE